MLITSNYLFLLNFIKILKLHPFTQDYKVAFRSGLPPPHFDRPDLKEREMRVRENLTRRCTDCHPLLSDSLTTRKSLISYW